MSVGVNPPKTPVTTGSNGIAAATLPNMCKMPGFVLSPLPNIGKSGDTPKDYTKTVKVDGNPVAIKGASFCSIGDMASKGTGGGMVSANTHGPCKFIGPGSMDVKFEGRNVQLLTDPMTNNGGGSGSPANSATMVGIMQVALMKFFSTSTETSNTTCASGDGKHSYQSNEASGATSLDDKIANAKAPGGPIGDRFEGTAAEHNKKDLKRSGQCSSTGNDNADKVWLICSVCQHQREVDQLHDDPAGGPAKIVEAKADPRLSQKFGRQLGRNIQTVKNGGASGLIYKMPADNQYNDLASVTEQVGKQFGVDIKVLRIQFTP